MEAEWESRLALGFIPKLCSQYIPSANSDFRKANKLGKMDWATARARITRRAKTWSSTQHA